jgi:branched-chain amino acid transport system permease protein
VLALAAPWVVYPTFLMKVLCFALFACAFNLLLGFAGLLSFGHAVFFGGSATCAGLCQGVGLTPELGILAGTAVAALLGGVVRLAGHPPPGHLLRDDHAGPGADGVLLLALQMPFTGGEDGLQGVPRGRCSG